MAQVWVATAPISVSPNVRAFNLNDIVPDSVATALGITTSGLVVRREVDISTGLPTHGVDPATQDELDALTRVGRLASHRLVGLGDSITAADAYLRDLTVLAGGRVRFVHNAGVGGNEIPAMLARFDTDVTPYEPTIVSLMGGTNDYTFGATDAQFRDRVRAFVAKVRSIGAIPLLFTSPPCNVLADPDRAKITRNNVWMAEYAARQGIALVDAYAALADPVGFGNYIAAYDSGDGVHPSAAGHLAVAKAAAAVLNPLLPPVPVLAATTADPTNLVANGLLKDGTGDGWADNWGQTWGLDSGTWDYTIVTDAAVPGGTMQRTTITAGTGHTARNQDVTTGFAPGDQLRLTALGTTTADTSGKMFWIATDGGGSTTSFGVQLIDWVTTRGLFDLTFTVPPSTTTLRIGWESGAVVGGTTGTVDIGAITLRNETALGLLAP